MVDCSEHHHFFCFLSCALQAPALRVLGLGGQPGIFCIPSPDIPLFVFFPPAEILRVRCVGEGFGVLFFRFHVFIKRTPLCVFSARVVFVFF